MLDFPDYRAQRAGYGMPLSAMDGPLKDENPSASKLAPMLPVGEVQVEKTSPMKVSTAIVVRTMQRAKYARYYV